MLTLNSAFVVVVVALPCVCGPFCLFSLPTPSSLVTSLSTTEEERELLGGVEDDGHRRSTTHTSVRWPSLIRAPSATA